MNEDGRTLLTDFGISQTLNSSSLELFEFGDIADLGDLGTLRYTSPERLNDGSDCTTAADVWSWGCVCLFVCGVRFRYILKRQDRLTTSVDDGGARSLSWSERLRPDRDQRSSKEVTPREAGV